MLDSSNIYIHNYPKAYPDTDFVHMIESPKVHDFVYDESFPYRLTDKKSKFIRFLARVVILLIVKPFVYFRYLLRIKGKRHIKEMEKARCHHHQSVPFCCVITNCNHRFSTS